MFLHSSMYELHTVSKQLTFIAGDMVSDASFYLWNRPKEKKTTVYIKKVSLKNNRI